MIEKTLDQRKLEIIVFIALTDSEEIVFEIEEILNQFEAQEKLETSNG